MSKRYGSVRRACMAVAAMACASLVTGCQQADPMDDRMALAESQPEPTLPPLDVQILRVHQFMCGADASEQRLTSDRVELFNAEGQRVFTAPVVDGQITGTARAYYDTGELMKQCDFENGRPGGVCSVFAKDGTVIQQEAWLAGARIDCVPTPTQRPANADDMFGRR